MNRITFNSFKKISLGIVRRLRSIQWYEWLSYISDDEKTAVFLAGSYRSGKSTFLKMISEHYLECYIDIYGEDNNSAYKNMRIRSDDTVKRLIHKSRKKIILFELVNDLQYMDRFLLLCPNAKGIWLYRDFHGVVDAAVEHMGETHKKIILGITNGSYESRGVNDMKERMYPETLKLLKDICNKNMSCEDGAAVIWYLRNLWYFDLNFHKNDSVMLVNSDDLFASPGQHIKRIFDFLSCPIKREFVNNNETRFLKRVKRPVLDAKIEHICQRMMDRLNEQYSLKA